MAHNKLYRNFIILQEDEKSHGISGEKPLSGYAKIEAKGDKCKISFYAQNLNKDDKYTIVLICYKKDMKQIVDLGSLEVTEVGKGEACNEYYINNIAGLDFSYEKISGAAICKYKDGELSFLMYGFMNGENIKDGWKKCKVLKHADKDNKIFNKDVKKIGIEFKSGKEEHHSDLYKEGCNNGHGMYLDENHQCEDNYKEHQEDKHEEHHEEHHGDKYVEYQEDKHEEHHGGKYGEYQEDKHEEHHEEHHGDNKCGEYQEDKHEEHHEEHHGDKYGEYQEDKHEEHHEEHCKNVYDKFCDEYYEDKYGNPNIHKNKDDEKDYHNCKEEYDYYGDEQYGVLGGKCDERIENISKFDEYESTIENNKNDFELSGDIGKFFSGIMNGVEEYRNKVKEIKYCKWYKIKVNSLDDMCNTTNYNKYTVAYYPMLNYYPYIKKYGYFMIGYKCDSNGNLKYIVYGVPGKRDEDEQPYGGKTGFVTWMNMENRDEGCWLMFYDFRNSTIVVPMK